MLILFLLCKITFRGPPQGSQSGPAFAKYHPNGLCLNYLSWCIFNLPDDGFSQKPKHVASNKTDRKFSCMWLYVLLSAELGFVRMPERENCWSLHRTTVQPTAVIICVKRVSCADLIHLTLSMEIILKWPATVTKFNRSAYPFTPPHVECRYKTTDRYKGLEGFACSFNIDAFSVHTSVL